jgi:hypothetical protein
MKHVFPLVTLIILTSCGATKQFVPFTHDQPLKDGKGRIYIIKPSFEWAGLRYPIFCDNVLVGSTKNGSYLCWDVKDGMHIIGNTHFTHSNSKLGSDSAENIVKINVKEGNSYYLKLSPKIFKGMVFKILSSEEGELNIKGRKKPKLNNIE